MEFESHEVVYSFYKEYAKSVGFGTTKLSSHRSRASKEFIDAKFSCIIYGNKQQSNDAINPRHSLKISCKAKFYESSKCKGWSLVLEPRNAQLLLELFMHMQEENPKNFYAIDLNEDHQLRNVFWGDSKGLEDFGYFADVVSFDTTYFTSKYKITLVLFVGVNHHIQPTLLGCVLITDETIYTFAWLLQTWFIAMGGHAPRGFFTGQNEATKDVVSTVFP